SERFSLPPFTEICIRSHISASRSLASNQPITGRARKASAAPYYKTTTFTGTISNSTGFTSTIQLLPDQ
ncbi:MAG: hypothetical protein VW239_08855, partial [Candidatus Nanopelagicales bacterium]